MDPGPPSTRVQDGAGKADEAAREYPRFLDLWSHAPPDHPYVLNAKGT